MIRFARQEWLALFFAASACSWMPHWSCHYYRLETDSTFVVGAFAFSRGDSVVAMAVYSLLIAASLFAIVKPVLRPAVAITSGLMHLGFAALHTWRLIEPFRFEVLGYPWSLTASFREVFIVGLFGLLSIWIGVASRRYRRAR